MNLSFLQPRPNSPKRLKLLVTILFVLLFSVIGVIAYQRYLAPEAINVDDNQSLISTIFVKPTKKAEEPLTGEKVDEDKAGKTPIAVVIENHPDARPQAGLDQASVVYETIAEGGITRFLAIFGPNAPDKIGPVRSARTFFVHWAREYNAPLGHVGGNIDALDLIKETGARDLDQFRYGLKAYHREPRDGIATEHTMFGSILKLREIVKQNSWDTGADFDKLTFKSDMPAKPTVTTNATGETVETPVSQTITVDFSAPSYLAIWTYHPETNDYVRTIGGKTYTAKNLIIQTVAREAVTSRNGVNRFEFTLTGSGKAKVVRDGTVVEGTWKKTGSSRTKFYDATGAEIAFNRGVTWLEVTHPELAVTIK